MKLICFLKGIYYSIRSLEFVSGHDYRVLYSNERIQILRCNRCKHVSIGYYRNIP